MVHDLADTVKATGVDTLIGLILWHVNDNLKKKMFKHL